MLNEQETAQDLSEEGNEPESPEPGPAWERGWHLGLTSHQYPSDLGGYEVSGEMAYDDHWQTWLDEIYVPPPANEYYW